MKKVLFVLTAIMLLTIIYYSVSQKQPLLSPLAQQTPKPKPLLAYTFDKLKNTQFPANQILLGPKVNETANFISQMFYFSVPEKPGVTVMKKVSGLVNIPKQPGEYSVLVMFRGFVPKETYQSGIGSQPSAKAFAQNGFITLAPDFLGYGDSDEAFTNDFENRFQTYTTALTLLSSLSTLNLGLEASYSGKIKADTSKVGIWGHSNGGQIALSALALSGLTYPTVVWAPVSTSFPYSILFYTNESDDQGQALRRALARFEEDYDTEAFSPPRYYLQIKAPLQIHQGTADHEVPVWWSDELVARLKKNQVDVSYFTYPGADHNLLPNGWSEAVLNSLVFYRVHFK